MVRYERDTLLQEAGAQCMDSAWVLRPNKIADDCQRAGNRQRKAVVGACGLPSRRSRVLCEAIGNPHPGVSAPTWMASVMWGTTCTVLPR